MRKTAGMPGEMPNWHCKSMKSCKPRESAAFQQVIRAERCSPLQLLKRVY
jgi:hypothetical protein